MIEFLTLFLGLTGGPQVVELDVAPEVAVVELRLDGEVLATREHPPWRFEVDFGSRLLPRQLEAVAYGAAGGELGRTLQVLNLPRPPAEVRLVFDAGDREAGGPVVRSHWESATSANPLAASVYLDGEPMVLAGATPAEQVAAIPVAGIDLAAPHLLEVELRFGDEVEASAHLVFGRGSGFYTSAELTALPVVGERRLRPERMAGWFRVGSAGDALEVVAVEKAQADVVLVRGPGVDAALHDLKGMPDGGLDVFTGGSTGAAIGLLGGSQQGGFRSGPSVQVSGAEEVRAALGLPRDVRLRTLLTRARTGGGHNVELDRFAISPDITSEMGGLARALGQPLEISGLDQEVRVWDSVALAGLRAAEANRRRAVVLVVTGEWSDASLYGEAAVRRFLDAIHVPLHVWRIVERGDGVAAGDGLAIRKFGDLRTAARELRQDVEQQRIVWLAGVHLPHAIATTASAPVEKVKSRK